MHNKKFLYSMILMFCLITMISFVSAVPPITSEFVADRRFVIEANVVDYYATNTGACVHIFVFNQTSGDIADSTEVSCRVELTNSNGTLMLEGFPTAHDDHFQMCRPDTLLTERGDYGLMILCNNSNMFGLKEVYFGLNHYGEGLTDAIAQSHNQSMWFLMILFGLSLFGVFKVENPSGRLACYWMTHLLFVIGTFAEWQFLHGYALSSIANEGIFKVLFYVSITAVFPMILLSIAWMFYIHTMNDTIKGFMDRGMDEDEAYSRSKSNRRNRK